MSVAIRMAAATGLVVFLSLIAFELVFYADLLAGGADPGVVELVARHGARTLVVGALVASLAAAATTWLVGKRLLRPLTSIVQTAGRLAEGGDFARRLPEDARDPEVAELTRTFNNLVARVDGLLSAQRQLLADTSHELRTPLTTVRGNLDILGRDLSADDRLEILADSRDEMDRMARLVRELLQLTAAHEDDRSDYRPVRLDLLAEEVSARIAGEESGRLVVEGEAVSVLGDEDRLTQLITNLVENALRHASEATGAVRVRVKRAPPNVLLEVEDDGPGIPPEALERVFDRFFRLDRGRARAQGGSGLGLSIVKHVTEAHGGRVWAENRPEGGARFSVLLPAEPSWVS